MSIPKLNAYPLPQAADFPANKTAWRVDPKRAALLIHDMQRYFLAFYGEDSALVNELVSKVEALRRWADSHGVPVIYTAQPTEQKPEDRALLNDMWGPGLTTADPAVQAVTPRLAPRERDTVLVKWRYSAFQRSDLQEKMKAWGRDQLVICGVYAHIGCMMTACDAFMRDIQAFMVGDAVADFSEEEHKMALRYVATRCGAVIAQSDLAAAGGDAALTREWLKAQVLTVLEDGDDSLAGDDNLLDYGLDSIRVMELVAQWQKLGLEIGFEDLAQDLTLDGWWTAIQAKLPQEA
ncbi:Acyl carrier protein/domain [Chromobacterium violaceum]|uniref:isochorismatase n=1 Tax=Chromobacterium violaceum (strain ATCC 12472 / DSM 30191 / JCM 1249 / CCUG 213 / NBRC 12614 / NCIMB 9131 / NCTC 9757 / MK) TaxID=243365 RepID=Q7NXZ3_CHRVO|nr:isochorismatase [Chromobacterium violaceum]AAQ59158.1 isochorismatase [Chromobacterium violaceum ATCC 12472]MBA8737267.1 isochorismatase [Chromobacterium violaceum]OQS08904.1 isochorismatase [Chromobacterium violaceum]OQS23408.1 isochorismatase [Chromobacterium violaceum]SUX88683.1 Isochorismatase [Chromobacterium violaceum]